MADESKITMGGIRALTAELAQLAPELRRGPALRALRAGAAPVLDRAVKETPKLTADVYKRGKMVRRAGTLRRALKIRVSKDVNKTGDVGVFVNFAPLKKAAIATFKAETGRRSADNPDDPFYWRWVVFATRRNKNPKPSLQIAGGVMPSQSLPAITNYLTAYFVRLNRKAAK